MSPIAISVIVFGCVFGGALVGVALRTRLPTHHLSSESKEVVKLSMGLVATMSALILGLLVASAKNAYDTQNSELTDLASRFVALDRVLAHYGPETKEIRADLKALVGGVVAQLDGADAARAADLQAPAAASERVYELVQALTPKTDEQRSLKEVSQEKLRDISQERWLMFEQGSATLSRPFLVLVVTWLASIFLSFGLYATPNATTTAALGVAALSVSTALYLIIEMYQPYTGLIRISTASMHAALRHLGL